MNLPFSHPITRNIVQRFSCRTYADRIVADDVRETLADFAASLSAGPLGSRCRFELVAATEDDSKSLRRLGTYGFIKGAQGFIIGAIEDDSEELRPVVGAFSRKSLEDYGYLMEKIILLATDLGLGTCWLGGSFNRSRFARKISATRTEIIPAVTALGYIAARPRKFDQVIRNQAHADHRRPWERLFFDKEFGVPLENSIAGDYAVPLEMVRLGPSASNLQPWRILKRDGSWHFYLKRRLGYRESGAAKLLKTADLQRVDMGIAMCHFELTALELGLSGKWVIHDPGWPVPNALTEYVVSWVA
jgi:nitroreductase